jgi:4-amino-4-deoxy-L-arabinose transferase-like glycosyltransferase
MRTPGRALLCRCLKISGWTLVCWVTLGWRLGYPSFWDPDEATYAQTTREMLAAHAWLVPTYDGHPFFDKPPLFYLLQMASFAVAGATELAARTVPALSALALIAVVAWFGRRLFNRNAGWTGALMFAVLPATFALSAYAILDMTFTLFLFGGAAMVTVAAINDRPRLQYIGYVLLAAAVLTKGPVTLVLVGLAFLLSLAMAPEARAPLLRLRWGTGLLIIVAISSPWFVYMWRRFGDDFINGYALKENLWLFARPMYGAQRSFLFYPKVMAIGLLPWTPLLAGRLIDGFRGIRITTAERLLWAWAIAVIGFFTFSQFKLDHYVFPAAPALCLLCGHAWEEAHRAERPALGTIAGIIAIPLLLVTAGIVLIPGLDRVPLDLPRTARLLPIALIAAGLAMAGQIGRRWRPSSIPFAAVAGLLAAYAVVITIGLPAFEQLKPTRRLAQVVAAEARPEDHVAMFRLNRWSSSWRFYVGRHSEALETPEELRRFFALPGRHYCAMMGRDYDRLSMEGIGLQVIHQEPGLFTTTGRVLRSGAKARNDEFLVVGD